MRILFVRLDEKNFSIRPGLSRGCSDQRMIRLLEWSLPWLLELPTEGNSHSEKIEINQSITSKVIKFVKMNPDYVFWEIFDFDGGKFSYAASKELFFENRRQGEHLKSALEEMSCRSLL